MLRLTILSLLAISTLAQEFSIPNDVGRRVAPNTDCPLIEPPEPKPGCYWIPRKAYDGCLSHYDQRCVPVEAGKCSDEVERPPARHGCAWVSIHDEFGCIYKFECERTEGCPLTGDEPGPTSGCQWIPIRDLDGCTIAYKCKPPAEESEIVYERLDRLPIRVPEIGANKYSEAMEWMIKNLPKINESFEKIAHNTLTNSAEEAATPEPEPESTPAAATNHIPKANMSAHDLHMANDSIDLAPDNLPVEFQGTGAFSAQGDILSKGPVIELPQIFQSKESLSVDIPPLPAKQVQPAIPQKPFQPPPAAKADPIGFGPFGGFGGPIPLPDLPPLPNFNRPPPIRGPVLPLPDLPPLPALPPPPRFQGFNGPFNGGFRPGPLPGGPLPAVGPAPLPRHAPFAPPQPFPVAPLRPPPPPPVVIRPQPLPVFFPPPPPPPLCPPSPVPPTENDRCNWQPILDNNRCIIDYECDKKESTRPIRCPEGPEKPRGGNNCNWIAILDKHNCIVDYECEPKKKKPCPSPPIQPDDTERCKWIKIKDGNGCTKSWECQPILLRPPPPPFPFPVPIRPVIAPLQPGPVPLPLPRPFRAPLPGPFPFDAPRPVFAGPLPLPLDGPLPLSGPRPLRPFSGPIGGPLPGPFNGPIGGPLPGPFNGPIGGPLPGPFSGPIGGPLPGPFNGPIGGPFPGPFNGPHGGPLPSPFKGPIKGPLPGPFNGPLGGPLGGPFRGGPFPPPPPAGGPPPGGPNPFLRPRPVPHPLPLGGPFGGPLNFKHSGPFPEFPGNRGPVNLPPPPPPPPAPAAAPLPGGDPLSSFAAGAAEAAAAASGGPGPALDFSSFFPFKSRASAIKEVTTARKGETVRVDLKVRPGEDAEKLCCWWAANGECDKNTYYMRTHCQKSCGTYNCQVADAPNCQVKVNTVGCPYATETILAFRAKRS